MISAISDGQKRRTEIYPNPKESVSRNRHLLEPLQPSQHDQRDLTHLHDKQVQPNLFAHNHKYKLVHEGREEEGEECSVFFAKVEVDDGFLVAVPEEKVVDWFVPEPGEFLKVGAVPPIRIEFSVSKAAYLCKSIADTLSIMI